MRKNLLLVAAIFISGLAHSQVTSGLVAKYSFNNGNANDEVGTNNGTVNGATLTTDRFGNASKAYNFNGTSSFIDLGDAPEFRMAQNDFSISMWVNYTATQQATLISKRAGGATNYNMYAISVINDPQFGGVSQNVWHFSRSSNSNDRDINAGNLSGAWHHIVLTHDYSDSSSIFVDGQFVGSDLNTVSGVYDISGYPLVLGYSSEANSNFYNGSIDDVCIYNRVINAAEANALYTEPNPVFSLTNGLVAKYSFNSATAVDESGNNNHGVVNGAVLTTDRFGNSNKAYQFAQNQTITVPDADTLDEMSVGMAISFWINVPPIVSNSNNLISKFSFCGGGADAYNIRVNTSGKIWAQIDDAGGFDSWQIGSITVADNNWHHVVIDWNKPNVIIYVDGVADLSGSYTTFNSTISNSPDVLAFGQVISDFCGANYEYNEKIDDICIYNRTLSALEITALYNEPNPATVGIKETLNDKLLTRVYPNPNNGEFTIQSQIGDVVNITNELGQVIETIELNQQNNFSYQVNHLQSGIYFLVGKTIKQKVIVSK